MTVPDMWLLRTATRHLEGQVSRLRGLPLTLAYLIEPSEQRNALQSFDHALLAALIEHCQRLKREGIELAEDIGIDDTLAGAEDMRALIAPYRAALLCLEGASNDDAR